MIDLSAADQANQHMVDRLIAEGALWSRPLIAAFRDTPRHRFLDRVYQYQRRSSRWREIVTSDLRPQEIRFLYSDRALITHLSGRSRRGPQVPISSSSQPSLMAQMLEDLQPAPGHKVLEIGAGTGYNAALLAHRVGPGLVYSVDVDRKVAAEAWDHLQGFPDRQVHLRHADGRGGFAEAAPFDRIMVTAATADLEPAWLEQLAPRGLVQAPLALAPGLAFVAQGMVTGGVFHGRLKRAAYFMPLRNEGEAGAPEIDLFPAADNSRTLPAPWAGWFDRKRPRINWLGFSQSLAFFGLLNGLAVHYRTSDSGQPVFGVSKPGEEWCWLGSQEWQVSGETGRDMGWSLYRAFLEAGGPWPTEFHLHASPSGGLHASSSDTYLLQGPTCQHLWELIEPRARPVWI